MPALTRYLITHDPACIRQLSTGSTEWLLTKQGKVPRWRGLLCLQMLAGATRFKFSMHTKGAAQLTHAEDLLRVKGRLAVLSSANQLVSSGIEGEVEGAVRGSAQGCLEGHLRWIPMREVPQLLLLPHWHAHAPAERMHFVDEQLCQSTSICVCSAVYSTQWHHAQIAQNEVLAVRMLIRISLASRVDVKWLMLYRSSQTGRRLGLACGPTRRRGFPHGW